MTTTHDTPTTTTDTMASTAGTITRVTGPLVRASGMGSAKLYEVVQVSEEKLMGEIIELHGDVAAIQVYEETGGIAPGDPVYRTGRTMSVALAPGLLESVYDGVQRPLSAIEADSGSWYIKRGIEADAIDRERRWAFTPAVSVGDAVVAGDVLGTVSETTLIEHKVMVPPSVSGTVRSIESGDHTVLDTIATIETPGGVVAEVSMLQFWPIREPRPKAEKIFPL